MCTNSQTNIIQGFRFWVRFHAACQTLPSCAHMAPGCTLKGKKTRLCLSVHLWPAAPPLPAGAGTLSAAPDLMAEPGACRKCASCVKQHHRDVMSGYTLSLSLSLSPSLTHTYTHQTLTMLTILLLTHPTTQVPTHPPTHPTNHPPKYPPSTHPSTHQPTTQVPTTQVPTKYPPNHPPKYPPNHPTTQV